MLLHRSTWYHGDGAAPAALLALIGFAPLLCTSIVDAGPATITSISPVSGPISGGTKVTLKGSGFTGTTLTLDEATIATQSRTDTQIVFTTPARDNGIASVKLSGNGPNAYAEFLYLPPSLNALPPGYITTVMGIGAFSGDGRIATNAQTAGGPLAFGNDGSLYFSEPNDNVIRIIRPDHVIERFAGTANAGYSGDGGPALQATLGHPRGLEIDSAGNVLLADSIFANAVRRIDINTNVITTIAGGANPGFSGDGGPALNAQLNDPLQLAIDGQGNLFVLDWGNVRIRRIDATSGTITTVAGNGTRGYSGDGGPATKATFDIGVDDAGGLAADAIGNVYLADTNNLAVRKIDAVSGIMTTFLHTDAEPGAYARAVTTDAAGNVYVAINPGDNGNVTLPRISKISPSGKVLQTWGKGQGFTEDGSSAADAPLGVISSMGMDDSGNIVYQDDDATRIRRINIATGLLETLGGIGPKVIGETGPALATVLSGGDVLFLPNGDMLTSEASFRIRQTDMQGNVSDFAGNGFFIPGTDGPALQYSMAPLGIAQSPNGDVLVVAGATLRIDTSGYVHHITSEAQGFSGDGGPAINAATHQACGVASDRLGNVFIADTNNNRIRRVDAQSGIITTIAGSGPVNPDEGYGQGTSTGDGGPATAATINTPYAVAVDTDGTIWIDENRTTLRKIDPNGIIQTLARDTIEVSWPRLNAAHNVVFGGYRVEPNGHIFSHGLSVGFQGLGDGGPAGQAKWGGNTQVDGVDTNSQGDIFFWDSSNRRIRAIRYGAVIAEPASTVSATDGISQTAPVCSTFPVSLQITLRSPAGNLENGIRVDFSAPSSGPSCIFPNGQSTYSVLTDTNGHASAVCSANSQVGSYVVTATPLNLGQSPSFSLSNAAGQTPCPDTLGNISTRLAVETGDNVLIGGFIITGTQPKNIIVRAIGPSLSLIGQLADPILELHDSSGALLETNDNWMSSLNKQGIVDSTIPPSNPLESAIVRTLTPGAYTAIVRGVNNGTGIGLVEAYDLAISSSSKLANISTRGLVQTGDNVLIAGAIVVGQASQKVIIRALGPSLPVLGKLADPTLELHDSNGALLEANDNWKDSPNKQAIIDSTIPPTNDLESAIVRTLTPGAYTAIVRGVNSTTGVALVEVYGLP